MAVDLWYNLSGHVRGRKESSSEDRLGTQTWRFGSAGPGASEPPNMKKHDPSWGGSLKSCPRKEGRRLSPAEELIDLTVSEWYSEKHRKPTPAEASMVNSSPLPGCPSCGSADFISQGREEEGWHTEIPLPVMREEIQPAHRHRVRFP